MSTLLVPVPQAADRAPLLREAIGEALRSRRQERRRTLRDVAKAAQVSLAYLSEIERGQKEVSSEILASVCEALGISMLSLLSTVAHAYAAHEAAAHPGSAASPVAMAA